MNMIEREMELHEQVRRLNVLLDIQRTKSAKAFEWMDLDQMRFIVSLGETVNVDAT